MINWGLNSALVLAQLNRGVNLATLLGMILVITGLVLLIFRGVPARPHDIFFSVAAIIEGLILSDQGWRLDLVLQFGQILLVIVTIFYTLESIQLRRIKRP